MSLTLSSVPSVEPWTVDQIRDVLRIDLPDDNEVVERQITAARVWLEGVLSSAFITQTWVVKLDCFPSTQFKLAKAPLQSVTSIVYTDDDGNDTTYSSSNYLVDSDSKPGRVVLKTGSSWPTVTLQEINGVTITYVAGYGDAATDVPMPIRHALALIIGDFYENRENSILIQGGEFQQLPLNWQRLVSNYRMTHLGVLR